MLGIGSWRPAHESGPPKPSIWKSTWQCVRWGDTIFLTLALLLLPRQASGEVRILPAGLQQGQCEGPTGTTVWL